jgi:hypothetical protein
VGSAKEEWMRQQELEPMYEWIEDNFGDDAGEEGSEEWEEAVQAFEEYCENQRRLEEEDYWQGELEWYIYTQSQLGVFDRQIRSIEELLHVQASSDAQFSLMVMLHAHTVAAVEAYLASTFIHKVTNSEELIRKLVESDPVFSKMKFTLKEIFEKQENLKITVATHLKKLIFHDLKKVKPMFHDVLDCDFGDISWLFDAVSIRHHCVHRAGYDKEGKMVELSAGSIQDLVQRSRQLVHDVDRKVSEFPETDGVLF